MISIAPLPGLNRNFISLFISLTFLLCYSIILSKTFHVVQQFQTSIIASLCYLIYMLKTVYSDTCLPSSR